MKLANDCYLCKLAYTRHKIVWGEGPSNAGVMLIGEGPGTWEDRTGRPFVERAKAGGELTAYLRRNSINRKDIYITNMLKCRVPDDEDPPQDCLEKCAYWLDEEIRQIDPHIIICAGKFSTSKFLPGMDMELVHGIGYTLGGRIIIPVYHPAAGLHRPEIMALCQNDFKQVARIWRGQERPKPEIYWDKTITNYEVEVLRLPEGE